MLGRASPPFCPTVERVLLNSCPRLTDRGLQTLSRRCPELRHIELRGCAQLTDVGVLELVSKCVHLNHLDVSGTCVRLDFFFSHVLPPIATKSRHGVNNPKVGFQKVELGGAWLFIGADGV